MKFSEFSISSHIKESLEKMGFSEATEVQKKVIPLVLQRENLLVRSETGTGKTAAFGIGLVELGEKALILAPTRELAIQIYEELLRISANSKLRIGIVYGGEPIEKQIRQLRKGIDILVATPGRLLDHRERGTVDLREFKIVVLDEADKMLEMGFLEDIQEIIESTGLEQLLLFSATLTEEVRDIVRSYVDSFDIIEIGKELSPNVEEEEIIIKGPVKFKTLTSILKAERLKTIIFLSTRDSVEDLARRLKERGFRVLYLHGGLKQSRREKVMDMFKNRNFDILVATDVAARGLHIEGIKRVINYHLPNDRKTYIHRLGRTGRMGERGKVINFVDARRV